MQDVERAEAIVACDLSNPGRKGCVRFDKAAVIGRAETEGTHDQLPNMELIEDQFGPGDVLGIAMGEDQGGAGIGAFRAQVLGRDELDGIRVPGIKEHPAFVAGGIAVDGETALSGQDGQLCPVPGAVAEPTAPAEQ